MVELTQAAAITVGHALWFHFVTAGHFAQRLGVIAVFHPVARDRAQQPRSLNEGHGRFAALALALITQRRLGVFRLCKHGQASKLFDRKAACHQHRGQLAQLAATKVHGARLDRAEVAVVELAQFVLVSGVE